MKPVLMELKGLLSDALISEKSDLRIKLLNGSMELLTELEMDFRKIEKAIKLELNGKTEEANKMIEKELDEINEEEYVENDEEKLLSPEEDF